MPTKNKLKKKKFTYVPRSTRLEALGKSLRINYLFYISILISALILKYDKQNTKSLKCIILSFILIAALGYLVHYIGHHINIDNQFFKSNEVRLNPTFPILNHIISCSCAFLRIISRSLCSGHGSFNAENSRGGKHCRYLD